MLAFTAAPECWKASCGKETTANSWNRVSNQYRTPCNDELVRMPSGNTIAARPVLGFKKCQTRSQKRISVLTDAQALIDFLPALASVRSEPSSPPEPLLPI